MLPLFIVTELASASNERMYVLNMTGLRAEVSYMYELYKKRSPIKTFYSVLKKTPFME